MKNIITLGIIILMFGCDRPRKVNFRKYIIENATNHKIKIEFYKYDKLQTIREKSDKGVIFEVTGDDGTGRSITAYKVFNADSLIITFDENKRQIYCAFKNQTPYYGIPNNKRNLLNDSSYIHESDKLYRYIFKEEDYYNAANL